MEFTISTIENPDPDNILAAFPFMVVDVNGNPWFGANTLEEAQNYINLYTY